VHTQGLRELRRSINVLFPAQGSWHQLLKQEGRSPGLLAASGSKAGPAASVRSIDFLVHSTVPLPASVTSDEVLCTLHHPSDELDIHSLELMAALDPFRTDPRFQLSKSWSSRAKLGPGSTETKSSFLIRPVREQVPLPAPLPHYPTVLFLASCQHVQASCYRRTALRYLHQHPLIRRPLHAFFSPPTTTTGTFWASTTLSLLRSENFTLQLTVWTRSVNFVLCVIQTSFKPDFTCSCCSDQIIIATPLCHLHSRLTEPGRPSPHPPLEAPPSSDTSTSSLAALSDLLLLPAAGPPGILNSNHCRACSARILHDLPVSRAVSYPRNGP
jgi:hypothetical protein